jgi:hypothetical protein
MKIIYFFSWVLLFTNVCLAQNTVPLTEISDTNKKAMYLIEDGDTIPIFIIKQFNYKDPNFAREWNRTVYFARRMYTYAKIIDSIVDEHEKQLAEIEQSNKRSSRKQRKENKKLKKTLWDEYSYEIKNLTNVRGDYLTKLVYRETGVTCYDLIKKYKNGRTAFFWNSVLRSFGSTNLKNEFNPKEDWMLKLVVEEIEQGKIRAMSRSQLIQEIKRREEREKKKK